IFLYNGPASNKLYTLSLHDALPILKCFKNQPLHEWIITQFLTSFERLVQRGLRFDYNRVQEEQKYLRGQLQHVKYMRQPPTQKRSEEHTSELQSRENLVCRLLLEKK